MKEYLVTFSNVAKIKKQLFPFDFRLQACFTHISFSPSVDDLVLSGNILSFYLKHRCFLVFFFICMQFIFWLLRIAAIKSEKQLKKKDVINVHISRHWFVNIFTFLTMHQLSMTCYKVIRVLSPYITATILFRLSLEQGSHLIQVNQG